MTKEFTKEVFESTYFDDYADSNGYYRILFNNSRAIQARELNQLQTIINKEVSRLGSNLFKDGAPIQPGGVNINNFYPFIKISSSTPLPSDLSTLEGVIFTGQTSGIKVRVYQGVASEGTDPETIYVQYLDQPSGLSGSTIPSVVPGETLNGTVSGGSYDIDVQTTNTVSNPAYGYGTLFSSADGSFFVQGRFVFTPRQNLIVSKYTNSPTVTLGFKVIQDIVTEDDTTTLYDNSGATPNLSSPGAHRYRIRLELIDQDDVDSDENFVFVSDVVDGKIVTKTSSSDGFNSIRDEMARRTYEESGNYIKKYFKTNFEPDSDDDTNLILRVEPGIAYIKGYRVHKDKVTSITIPKATDTLIEDNEGISVDYGNYFQFDSGKGMFEFDNCEQVNLMTGSDNTGSVIGTANVRALNEGTGLNYNLHLFNIQNTNDSNYSLRDVKSVSVDSSTFVNLVLEAGQSVLKEPNKRTLLFDMPIQRPKTMSSVSLTTARKFDDITNGSGEVTITLSAGGETFENTGDWIVSSAGSTILTGFSVSLSGGATSATISGLPNTTNVEILAYVRKGNGKVRQKTLTETTVTTTLDSDGSGNQFIPLGKADIFSVTRIRKYDSDGSNIFQSFQLDPGMRDTHYKNGRLVYGGSGVDSNGQNIFVRFNYFTHGTGDFFSVNSYNGQVDYKDIPAHRLTNGSLVSLRDVLDFRPVVDSDELFTSGTVNELPQPTDLVEADVEYYLPRLDKLVVSQTGEFKYITGTSSLQPKYPSTPVNSIDLYKYELNPNTLHTKDLKSTIIPLKGYTMEDIGKLESKVNKLEELTTLSLLELSTNNLKVLDSSGFDRTKSGFFVDNFTNQMYSDTKNSEYRASIDPRAKYVRPSFRENNIDLYFDSSNSEQLNVVKKGDNIYLDYSEVLHTSQTLASKTENVNPFFIEKFLGTLNLSPHSDFWKETDVASPRVVDGGTQLDTRQALLWNNWEWNWGGVDINDLQVGASASNVTGVSTTTVANQSEPRLIGQNVTEEVGDWVVEGTTTQNSILANSIGDVGVNPDFSDVPDWGENWWWMGIEPTFEFNTNGVNTSTLSQTTTITTENEYATDTEYQTNTSTQTTVNRIASESTIREVIGNRVVDLAIIPWMRTRKVSFKAEGLRPNTKYFPFFDGVNVSSYCRETPFKRISDLDPTINRSALTPNIENNDGTTDLITDDNGKIEGEFEIPNNNLMRFRTGTREFALLDISVYDVNEALSSASTFYVAEGVLETTQDVIKSTRVLEVVGSQTTNTSKSVRTETSFSTDTVVETQVATDVVEERTVSESDIFTFQGNWSDPLAQSFEIPDENGIFLTKVRVYFKEKDLNNLPIWMEIRPLVNGSPSSSQVVPGSRVTLNASEVNLVPTDTISDMVANGTDFVFEEPLFLDGFTEWAVVLRTNSNSYKVYISEVEDFVLGSTERRISKQPSLGSLFKSQNSSTWEPNGRQDLAFQLYRADFVSSGNVILENVDVPLSLLTRDPFISTNGSNLVQVIDYGHGLRKGDVTTIKGLDSAENYNGISATNLLGQKTVVSVDGLSYTFEADSSDTATSTGRFGGGRCRGSRNMNYDLLRPTIDVLQPETTNITFSGKFTSASSLVDSDTGRFSKDTNYSLIRNKHNNIFNSPKSIYTPVEETAELSGERSATIQCTLLSTDSRVSPMIDMQRCGLGLVGNMIDKQDSASTSGFNKPITFYDETNPQKGTSLAKHITVPTNLTEEAVGLKILVAANRPPEADFIVYYRTANEDEVIREKNWVQLSSENTLPGDTNKNIFREYRYMAGGIGGKLTAFTQFQVKIVFRSTNSAKVPVIRDLRVIALTV